MTERVEMLDDLIARLEKGFEPYEADAICYAIHAVDPCPNKNGTTRGYIHSIELAATLIPQGMIYAVTHDHHESRATVGHFPFDSAALGVSKNDGNRDAIALCTAALKARKP